MRQHRLEVPLSHFTDSIFPKLSLLQVPVPVFLTVTPNSSDATMKSVDMIQTNSSEGERNLKSEMEKKQETEDRQKDNKGHDINAPKGETFDKHDAKARKQILNHSF